MNALRNVLSRGILVRSCHHHNVRYRDRLWESGNLGQRTLESLITTEWFNRWIFINDRQSKVQGFKTLTLGLALKMPMSRYWHTRWQLSNPLKSLPTCNTFAFDPFGDHLQTCQTKSVDLRFTTGSFTNWGRFLVPWDIGLKYTILHLRRARNEFCFLHASCFANLKDVVGLIMVKPSAMRISIPLDLRVLPKWHMLSVYFSLSLTQLLIIDLAWHFSFPWSSPFFILLEINFFFFQLFALLIKVHPIRASGDSSSMFVVFGFDLIIKVWFVYIVLTSTFLGFSWRCSWSFFVVTPYISLCICHLPKRHMMSTNVWVSSTFVFIIVWTWQLYPLLFTFFYSAEIKKQTFIGFLLIIGLVWHLSFPWSSPFFILMKINYSFSKASRVW